MAKICSEVDCERISHAKGLCNFHYVRARVATVPACIEEGCQKPSRARGMCHAHYSNFLRGADVEIEDYNDFWEFVKKELKIA